MYIRQFTTISSDGWTSCSGAGDSEAHREMSPKKRPATTATPAVELSGEDDLTASSRPPAKLRRTLSQQGPTELPDDSFVMYLQRDKLDGTFTDHHASWLAAVACLRC